MRQRDRISLAIGGAALVTSVLVIGSALRWTQATVAILVALALGVQLFARRALDRVSPIVLALSVAVVLTALQLVPLPPGVVEALNPTGADLRADGAALAGTHPWSCLSMDPAGTLHALAFFIILLGVAVLSLRFVASERGRFLALGAVAITCGLAAAITGIHTLVNADSLYGVYQPAHATPPVLGPLLNPNHLGGLMAFGAVLSIGLAFYERQATQLRILWVVIAVGCTIVALTSLSRGAVISLCIGTAICASLLVGRRFAHRSDPLRRGKAALSRDLPIAIVIVVGLAIAVFTSASNVADQLDETQVSELQNPASKYEAWHSSFDLISESPWTGVGRGALEPTFTRVHDASAYVTFSHLENEYLQPIVEWGIPGSLVMGLCLAWCMITAIRKWRDGPLAAAALGAMGGVMFQQSVDFGVELLGLAVPVVIVAASLQIVPFREVTNPIRVRLSRAFLIVALGGAAALLLTPSTRNLQEDHDALVAQGDPTIDQLDVVIERHPLDYFGFAEVADDMTRIGDTRGVKFLNHALELHPTHPGLHRLAGRLLAGTKRNPQAALEYATAMHGTLAPKELLTEIITMLPAVNDAASAIPADYPNIVVVLHVLADLKREDVAEAWLARVIERPQTEPHVIDMLYELATNRKDWKTVKLAAEARIKLANTTSSRLMLAKALFQLEDYEGVRKALPDVKGWQGRIDEQGDGWLLLCDSFTKQSNFDRGLECLHQLDGSGVAANRRSDVTHRINDIDDHLAAEVRAKAIQDLEHSKNLPDVPIVHETAPDMPKPPTIQNPLKGGGFPKPK